jgi:flagella basal body P-ring formation protein FlgA
MELKTVGKAIEGGAGGEIIRVKNVKSGSVIQIAWLTSS